MSMPFAVTRGPVWLGVSGIEDTASQPMVSHLGGGPLQVCVSGNTSGGIPLVTGYQITSVTCASQTDILRGVNTNVSAQLGPQFLYDGFYNTSQPLLQNNMHRMIGPGYSLFTNPGGAPAAPTCNVATGGPPYSMSSWGGGTYSFAYSAIYPNGGYGLTSAFLTCTMNGTTQQATLTVPSRPAGAIGYFWYAGPSGQLGNQLNSCNTVTLNPCLVPIAYAGFSNATAAAGGLPESRETTCGPTELLTTGQAKFNPMAFSALGTPANGIVLYRNDCTIANPRAGGGTGAFAKHLNGVWVCN